MKLDINYTPKQIEADQTIEGPSCKYLLYGGAKGGGKSVFGCYWIFLKCLELIKKFDIRVTGYPVPVGFMGRKRGVDFNDTTLETFKRFIPPSLYKIREQDKEIVILDRVKIIYGGFDSEENIKKFNSAEFAYFFIDQAEEITRDDFGLLCGTLRLSVKKQPVVVKGLLTANPADCWLKDEFIHNNKQTHRFLQALPSDNPFLPEDYVETLREAFRHRPELVEAYVHGNWDVIAGSQLVIKPSWVRSSVKREISESTQKRVVACDPARYGDDETVIYVLEGPRIIHSQFYGQRDTMYTAGHLLALQRKYQAKLIAVDSIGIGGGIVDRLKELKAPVFPINVGERASTEKEQKQYQNKRAEIYWKAGLLFADEKISIPDEPLLIRQLGNVQYEVVDSNGKIKIEPKQKIKERMGGKSPDRADAFVLGLYALNYVSEKSRDFFRNRPKPRRSSYGWERFNRVGIPFGRF